MPEIPEHLLRRGRPVDPEFSPSELLFRAVARKDLTAEGFLVNRGKYSESNDVILLRPSHGIAAFEVQDVPEELDGPEGAYRFKVEHAPEEDNYAHSEVRTYKEGQRHPQKPPRTLRTLFRLQLSARVRLLKEPAT
jgi:hypothetical protein